MLARSIALLLLASGLAAADKKPALTLGIPTVSGGLDARALAAVLRRNETKLLVCYKAALDRRPDLHGTATATFTVEPDGKVIGAAAPGLGDDVGACLASTIAKLAFGRPRDGKAARVTYPLSYERRDDVFASITGSGIDDQNVLGGLAGNDPGGGGFGLGQGGGIGSLGGNGSGYGRGTLRGRPGPRLSMGLPNATGDLDRAIIRRYVRRHILKLQYCYEKQLLKQPTLAGTVVVQFTIGGDGIVSNASAAGVDAEVSSCVATVLRAIEFPRPRGGGAVMVTYPFTFRPT